MRLLGACALLGAAWAANIDTPKYPRHKDNPASHNLIVAIIEGDDSSVATESVAAKRKGNLDEYDNFGLTALDWSGR